MSKTTPSARSKQGKVPQRKSKANEGTENPRVQSLSQTTEFAVTKSGRILRTPEAPTTQDSECSQRPSKTCLQLRRAGSAKPKDEAAEATSEMPEAMPAKSQSKQSKSRAPEVEKEGKVPQRKARGGRGKGAQDEERRKDSATAIIQSPLAPGQLSACCPPCKQTGSAQRRRESTEATSEMPEAMPAKSQSKQSNRAPEDEKEGKVPQRKARGGRGKGAQDEERRKDSATATILSPLAPGQLSACCPPCKQTGSAQRRRESTEATSEMPEAMPAKSQSKQSNRAPEDEKEGKIPQRKARVGRGKGAQDEERREDSATATSLSPLALGQLFARCPAPKQTGSAQRRRESAGHLGQLYSKSASADLCESSEQAAAALAVPSQDVARRIKERVKALPLKRVEIIKAAKIINGFVDPFISYLKECSERPYFKEVIKVNTGSYYEFLKISHPDEFDVMLALPVTSYVDYRKVVDCSGLYYKVTLTKKLRSFPTPFLLEDGSTVSPVKVLEEFRKHVMKFIASSYKGCKMTLTKKKPNCPAVTVVLLDDKGGEVMSIDLVPALEISNPWPDSCGLGKDVEKWLGKKTKPKNKSFYFVAKQPRWQGDKEIWRISFSHVEKEILNNHGNTKTCCEFYNTKCCRKNCIRLLKILFKVLMKNYPCQPHHMCSYYVKTSFFHTLTQWNEDSDWKPSDITCCFLRVLDDFIQHLEKANLPHFFIPNCNLFYRLPHKELQFLLELLREQKGNGLQAFAVHEE